MTIQLPRSVTVPLRAVALCAIVIQVCPGCVVSKPFQLVPSTAPIAADDYEAFAAVEGQSCFDLLFHLIPLSFTADLSLYQAKSNALAQMSSRVDGLIDVTVDIVDTFYPLLLTRRCTVIRGYPFRYVNQRDLEEEEQDTDAKPVPPRNKWSGRGVKRYDRFKKQQVFEWRDAYVKTGPDQGLFLSFVAITEHLGRAVGKGDLSISIRAESRPSRAAVATCRELTFLIDGEPLTAQVGEFARGRLNARIRFDDLEAMGAATKIEGRLCSREFAFDSKQVAQLGAFAKAINKRVARSAGSSSQMPVGGE